MRDVRQYITHFLYQLRCLVLLPDSGFCCYCIRVRSHGFADLVVFCNFDYSSFIEHSSQNQRSETRFIRNELQLDSEALHLCFQCRSHGFFCHSVFLLSCTAFLYICMIILLCSFVNTFLLLFCTFLLNILYCCGNIQLRKAVTHK